MPPNQPIDIDYARADTDVVRKQFRRRVVMFAIATVVVMVIGGGWMHSLLGGTWGKPPIDRINLIRAQSNTGWIMLFGPTRTKVNLPPDEYVKGNDTLGMRFFKLDTPGRFKWGIHIRYRTLFILAMIPWIITLIRMIRVGRVKHAAQIDQ